MTARPSADSAPSSTPAETVATLVTNNWTGLRTAAEHVGLDPAELERAIADGEVRGLTTHPDQPGEWMVPLADVEAWLRRRELARVVLA